MNKEELETLVLIFKPVILVESYCTCTRLYDDNVNGEGYGDYIDFKKEIVEVPQDLLTKFTTICTYDYLHNALYDASCLEGRPLKEKEKLIEKYTEVENLYNNLVNEIKAQYGNIIEYSSLWGTLEESIAHMIKLQEYATEYYLQRYGNKKDEE